ncbi:hypothetical protein [Aestuariibaculum suncheonense]|uniref:Uncharacterized protein n=1 Tax=Aestuariibaculum suncheonense TaxID=1028745 RepID=A0A8J6Q3W6_9FLAO|nr:hypothetical protein [Aestuariibaculum suncheonense]MBD0834157.1 hypothetical protein [Aestuariibaculum suncheonense]
MAVIVDVNCIPNVFSRKSLNHQEFKPVKDWIIKGKGLMVYGGSKYMGELKKLHAYLPIIRMLKDVGKVYVGDSASIDALQEKIEALREDNDFDDPHLPAIVIATKCRVICSEDTRSIKHVQDGKYYPRGVRTPVYYTSSGNSNLLSDNYVDKSLKPLLKLNKSKSEIVEKLLK